MRSRLQCRGQSTGGEGKATERRKGELEIDTLSAVMSGLARLRAFMPLEGLQ